MSGKLIIEELKNAVLAGVKVLNRDIRELSQLQAASPEKVNNFAASAIMAAKNAIVRRLQSMSPLYKIYTPGDILTTMKNVSEQAIQPVQNTKIQPDEQLGCFVVNPCSGPQLLKRGTPAFCISAGIVLPNDALSEVSIKNIYQCAVYDFLSNTFFTATQQNGAYADATYAVKLKASKTKKLTDATIAVCGISGELRTCPSLTDTKFKRTLLTIQNISLNVEDYLTINSPELGIAYVASGKLDACFLVGNTDFNSIACGLLLAKEVGLTALTLNGDVVTIETLGDQISNGGFCIASPSIVSSLQQVL